MDQALITRISPEGTVVWRKVAGRAQSQTLGYDVHVAPSGLISSVAGRQMGQTGSWVMVFMGDGTIDGCEVPTVMTYSQMTSHDVVTQTPTWHPIGDTLTLASRVVTPSSLPVSDLCAGTGLGTRFCDPAVPNSSGFSAVISAKGSKNVANNNVLLVASRCRPNRWACS